MQFEFYFSTSEAHNTLFVEFVSPKIYFKAVCVCVLSSTKKCIFYVCFTQTTRIEKYKEKTAVFDPSTTQFSCGIIVMLIHSLPDGTIFYFIFYISIDEIEKTFLTTQQQQHPLKPNEKKNKGQFKFTEQ